MSHHKPDTVERIRPLALAPSPLLANVANFIRLYRTCAAQKSEQKSPAGLMGNKPKVVAPWQMISLNFMGPLPRSLSGNTHILVVTDFFSKFVVTSLYVPLRPSLCIKP